MTAQEYLEQLQYVHRRHDYLVEILYDRYKTFAVQTLGENAPPAPAGRAELVAAHIRKTVFQELPEEAQRELEVGIIENLARPDPNRTWAVRAHQSLWATMSDGGRQFLADIDIAVGELDTASFNSSAIPVPGTANSWVLALNHGVSSLVYAVARLIAATYQINGSPADTACLLSKDRAADILHERLTCYVHLGVPFGREYEITASQVQLASAVTTMAERFVYAHELAHVLLGHIDNAPLNAMPDDWSEARQTVHAHEQELEADLLAWMLVTQSFVENLTQLQAAYAGICLFFRIASVLEMAGDISVGTTHPSAEVRLARMKMAAAAKAAEVGIGAEQVTIFDDVFVQGLERLLAKAPTLPGHCPLGALLARCSSGAIPDYMSFQDDIFSLLSHAAPNKLCRAMGRALGEAELELQAFESRPADRSDRERSDTHLRAFNRFKLIGGMMGLYLIPEIGNRVERVRLEYVREAA
jgi:hypothetical protein